MNLIIINRLLHVGDRSIPAFAQYVASDKCFSDFYNPSPPISMFPILGYYH